MKRLIAFCVMALAMMSCVKESISVSEYGQKTLTAKVENNNVTKVGFTDGTAEFFWTKCDKIGVTTTTCADEFSFMTLNDEDAGKASGTFNGIMSGDPAGYAVYPYVSDMHSMSGSTLTYYLPNAYEYTSLDATYANAEGNSHNAPMWGAIEGGSVSFKHLGGVIAFEINELPANTQNLVFKLTAAAKINGSFTADLSASDPKITTSEATEDTEKSITVTFSTADAQTSGYIYVPVPTGTIGTLKAKVFNGSEEIISANWQNITIARKDIRRATIGNKTIVGGATSEVNSADDVTEALKGVDQGATDVTVEVKNEVAGPDNTIEIPSTLQTETTTIVFNTISDDAVITINNEENGNYSGQVIIEIPETATIPTIEAIIPDGEVYIKQGNVTTLIVSSADNTTIIGSEVAVSELIVKKGNVRIKDGGNVAAIQRSTENSETVYVIYESATAPTIELGEGVLLVSAAEFDLLGAVANGGDITLTSNVVLTTPLVIAKGKTVSIDLNGYTISQEKNCTASYSMISNNGNLTIKDNSSEGNGKISFKDTSKGDPAFGWGSYTIRNEGTLTIENGTIEHLGEQPFATHMICALFQYSGSSTINGGVISTPAYRSARLWKGDMTITNGTFDGQLWVQSVDDSAKLTISGGSFSPNGNDGSSVFVGNVTTGGVHHTVEFNVTGGNFETKLGCNDPSKLTGNRITGGVFTETAKLNTNSGLIAEGGVFEPNADGTYTLSLYFVEENGTLTLLRDMNLSEILVINKSITLDGNGKTLTSTAGRAINVEGEVSVTIKNLTIDAKGERAINVINTDETQLTIENVVATAKNYVLMIATSASNVTVGINNCEFTGLNTVNVAGANAKVTINDTDLTCDDQTTTESYAAIAFYNTAVDSKATMNGGTVTVNGDSFAAVEGAEGSKVTFNGTTGNLVVENHPYAIIYPNGYAYSFDTFEAACEQAKEGETITLTKDLTLSEILVINKPITLDGNGKTLTSTAGRAINVDTEGNVGIKNLTISAAERAINIINKPANVTVANVTATAKNNAVMMATTATGAKLTVNDSNFTGLATVNVASANSQVEINNTNITNCDNTADENYGAISVFKTATNSTVVVNGGKVVVADDSVAASIGAEGATVTFNGTEGADNVQTVVAYIGDAGYTTIDEAVTDAKAGETITLISDLTLSEILVINKSITLDGNGKKLTSTAGRAINVEGEVSVTIKNLTIDAKDERAINVINTDKTQLTIEKVVATAKNYVLMIATSASNVTAVIYDCKFTGLNAVNIAGANANVTINNTDLTCDDQTTTESYAAIAFYSTAVDSKATMNGGTVTVNGDSFAAVEGAEGSKVTFNGTTGNLVVENHPYAIIYPNGYAYSFDTFEAACEQAKEGETITLTKDVTIKKHLNINKSINLDFAGHTLYVDTAEADGGLGDDAIWVRDNANVTITGNGTINFISEGTKYASGIFATGTSVVTIENGTFTAAAEAVFVQSYATVVINGGAFKSTKYPQYTLNLKDTARETAKITVNGGSFYQFNPADNTAEGENTNFVASGKTVTESNGWYTVE